MAISTSSAVAHARLDAIETTIGAAPLLRIYSGTSPADCAAALAGNVQLAEMVLPSDWLDSATAGRKAIVGSWGDLAADATGTASFFRIYESTATTCHMQGTVSAVGGGGNLQATTTSFVVGRYVGVLGFVLRASEAPTFSGVLTRTLAAAASSAAGAVGSPTQYALEMGPVMGQSNLASAPTTGALFSAWVRTPRPAFPGANYTHGNIYPFRVYGTNWGIDCIAGNVGWNDSNGDAFYNANTGFGIDGPGGPLSFGDETWYLEEWLPISYINDWVFVAWFFMVDGSGTFTKRQWVKYRGQAAIGPQSTDWTLSALRAQAITNGWSSGNANAYTPSGIDHLAVCYTENDGSVMRCRVEARTTVPSNAYIDSIADIAAADGAAWAFYPCDINLSSGRPQLVDTSGNGRTPTPSVTGLYRQGVLSFNSPANTSYLLGLSVSAAGTVT